MAKQEYSLNALVTEALIVECRITALCLPIASSAVVINTTADTAWPWLLELKFGLEIDNASEGASLVCRVFRPKVGDIGVTGIDGNSLISSSRGSTLKSVIPGGRTVVALSP